MLPHDWFKVGKNKTKRQNYKTHGAITFQGLSTAVADRWDAIDDETREFLDTIYANELQQYEKDTKAYIEMYGKDVYEAQRTTYKKRSKDRADEDDNAPRYGDGSEMYAPHSEAGLADERAKKRPALVARAVSLNHTRSSGDTSNLGAGNLQSQSSSAMWSTDTQSAASGWPRLEHYLDTYHASTHPHSMSYSDYNAGGSQRYGQYQNHLDASLHAPQPQYYGQPWNQQYEQPAPTPMMQGYAPPPPAHHQPYDWIQPSSEQPIPPSFFQGQGQEPPSTQEYAAAAGHPPPQYNAEHPPPPPQNENPVCWVRTWQRPELEVPRIHIPQGFFKDQEPPPMHERDDTRRQNDDRGEAKANASRHHRQSSMSSWDSEFNDTLGI